MASSNPDARESGFATPAAAAISLAIAVVASGVMAMSLAALKEQRRELASLKAEYALEGGQAEAELTLLASQTQGPARWSMALGPDTIEVVAEPEAAKLGLHQAMVLSDADLARWRVVSSAALRDRLEVLASDQRQVADLIGAADASPAWRLCARSAISPYGQADHLPAAAVNPPAPGTGGAHVGQLWRIRLASASGWVDDRVVRFTGSQERPVAVAARWFGRGSQMGEACANLLATAPA